MRRAGSFSRRVSLWALLAFVWQVLAMSGGLSARPTFWAEACTPGGIVKVALRDDAGTDYRGSGGADCTWCQLMTGAAEPGPVPTVAPRRPASRRSVVAVVEPEHASHAAWVSLPIRAPPVAA